MIGKQGAVEEYTASRTSCCGRRTQHLRRTLWGLASPERRILLCSWRFERVTLQGLVSLLTQRPEFRRLIEQVRQGERFPALTGITEAARPFVIAALAAALKQPLLLIVEDELQAHSMVESLKQFVERPQDVFCLPDRDALPYERLLNDALTMQQRMQALIALTERGRNPLVVCSARVVTQLIIPAQGAGSLALQP